MLGCPILVVALPLTAGNFRVVQNFAIFTDRSASAKIKIAKIAASTIFIPPCMRAPKTAKISFGALGGDSAKFAPAKISRYTVCVQSDSNP